MPVIRNRPVSKLIKLYVDKKSGHVQDARAELRRRFDYLDWSQQKQIALIFLSSGVTDRNWMYTHMLNWWDDCFAAKIQKNWEQYREGKCAWIVIKYLSMEYVMAHLHDIGEGDNYYHICRRFGAEKDFVIDDTKLNGPQCFFIHALAHKPLDGE